MKTILYNPIFINPQAYYVFPRLTRYLQPDNESTAEPANYIGTIEVKVIAYGDTTLKRTYTNTDSIDLSEFKNTWIRISLFTKVGSCVLGEWKIGNMESDLPYIDPEVLASLKAVVIVGNKTNNDSDRAIVKNLVDASNPFVISNASYNLNSGYGKYNITFQHFPYRENIISINDNKVVFDKGGQLLLPYPSMDRDIPSFKVKVSGLSGTYHFRYYYRDSNGAQDSINMAKDGIYELPICYNVQSSSDGTNCGFANNGSDIVTIEQVPEFQGAFVTDGVNDTIISTKTVAEMGITDEVTVVSMIHQITLNTKYNIATTNYIENSDTKEHVRTDAYVAGKTGIYGYTASLINSTRSTIGYILGDIRDYQAVGTTNKQTILDSKFSVEGRVGGFGEVSSVAWYWTVIANKVLTADQINQVIAYYDLDRTLSPDIYCDVAKQGITNSNHTDFDDKLIDYSGNGRDIQLNNLAWDGDSGIGKYNYPNWKVNVTQGNKYARIVYYDSINGTYSANFKGITDLYKSYGLSIEIRVNRANTVDFHSIKEDGIYTITPPDDTTSIDIRFGGENVYNASCDITITQIPSHAGALCLDGVNDFGKVTGMPIYKDYTFISKYQRLSYREAIETEGGAVIASKSYSRNQGAFIFNGVRGDYAHDCYSFGLPSSNNLINDKNLEVYYQTKYTNQGKSISSGTAADSDILWLGTVRDNDNRFINAAIYSLMSFPYSMSKFLIERQLKKHKLGTLYPNMVEFRPVIKKDDRIKSIKYYIDGKTANIGQYYPIGTGLGIAVETVQPYMVKSLKVNGVNTIPNADYKGFNARLDSKSPQKITMDIQVDTNLIQWNPIITSTVELTTAPTFAIRGTSTLLKPGDWIPKNSEIWVIVTMNNLIDELRKFSFNGTFINIPSSSYNPDTGKYGFPFVIDNESTQNINLTIDEYIRFEDIVQPYPVLLRFNDENGNEVSWGGKFRVGSTITRIGSAADSNLLPNIYNIFGLLLNNNQVTSSKVIVEKTMVFKAKSAYIFDNNEPNCILSPRLLRIPNSSYKILGYIPDISGHGNHGVIHNSAYGEGSGVNKDGSYQFDGVDDHITIPTVTGGGKQVLMKVNNNTINSMLYDQRSSGASPNSLYDDFAIYCTNSADNNQIAYQSRLVGNTYIDGILNTNITCEDLLGVLHNITITCDIVAPNNGVVPNIGRGGVLKDLYSKVALYDFMLFDSISTDDKIKELNEYVGIEAKVELPPYYWDNYGKTNLDEDKNYTANLGTVKDVIEVSQPAIFAENWYDGNPEPVLFSPIINQTDYSIEVKANKMDNNFTMMLDVECDTPLPAFKAKFSMVGTAISVNLKYYINGGSKIIDVFKSGGSTEPVILDIPASERSFIYGTNTDNYPNILIEVLPADNGTRYGLTNTNFAYDKMSGYGGYSLGRFDKSWSSSSSNNTSVIVVSRNPYDITLKKLGGNSDWEFNNTELKVISNPVSVKFKSNKNIRVTCDYHYYPVGGNSEGVPLGITSKDLIANEDTIITISPISQENIDKYNIDINRGYYLVYFQLSSTLAVNEEVTIEMLPLYPNGLVYDGVTDYSNNNNIPAFTDYTYIIKRQILKGVANSAVMYKGNVTVNQGGAFICNYCEPSNVNMFTDFSFGGLFRSNNINNPIIYSTKTSINGNNITPGEKIDTTGINIGKWVNYLPIVFYKLILYPKTIPLLQINFLKNLMERDEIIDLNNKIFIQE